MALNDQFFQELKYKTDVEDIISTYVSLKRRGSTLVGLCPFHNEKTPSFTVYPNTQSFYCFGCGIGGDSVTFLKNVEHLDYMDAVKMLADRVGLQMPQDGYDDSLSKKRRRILEMNRLAAKFYHNYMMSDEGKVGLDYFLHRGLSLNTIRKFGLGFAPNSWDSLLRYMKNQGYSASELTEAGLAKSGQNSYYDIFRNRVMTPIIDVRGNVIAFGGRVLDDSKPKYINTQDTLVYKKTNELFAMNLAKDSKEESLILCEGYMDVIALHQAGFTNSVAGCGTAITNEQVRLIARYAKEVILTYDRDEAGRKALNKAMRLFDQTDIKVRIPELSGGKDPDEIIRVYGRDKFKGMLDGASNEIEFKILESRNQFDLDTTQGKVDFLNSCIKILAFVSPIEQDLYISKLAEEVSVDKQNIRVQMEDFKRRVSYRDRKKEYSKIIRDDMQQINKAAIQSDSSVRKVKAQDRLIGLLIRYPDCFKLCDGFDVNALNAGFEQKVFALICDKLKNGYDTDLIQFGQLLSSDEMARLAAIVAKSQDSMDAKKEFKDCMRIIFEEFEKSNESTASDLPDDEYRNLFKIKSNT